MAVQDDYTDRMTPEEVNMLRDYIKSSSGAKLLRMMMNQEVALKTGAWMKDATTDTQIKLVNQEYGFYQVRTMINDIITVPVKRIDTRNGQ